MAWKVAMTQVPRFRATDPAIGPFYRENGYCVVESIRTASECDALIELAHGFPTRAPDDFMPLMQPQRTNPEFLGALRHKEVIRLVETMLEGPASGLQMEFFFGHPGTKGYACHQDSYYVEPSSGFISIWSALTDVTAEMGPVYAYPGSHRFGRLPVRRLNRAAGPNQDPNAANEETVLPDDAAQESVVLPVPKGGILVLHGDIVHGSMNNASDHFRYALLCTYIRKGARFRPGGFAQRAEIDLHAPA
jgi:ectoine hydroxylase-related dioxygenase (phytanoyl-CoA dioxygenase family)